MKNLSLFSVLLLLISCATVDVPPGGDKDTTPPKLVTSNPDSAALNVNTQTINLTFDEYFSLNNLNTNLIISPPLTYPLKPVIKGKNLTLKLTDTLKTNTTYQFYFGNSIADLTENNKTKDLRLVFSTGSQLDTSIISGFVKDAFDNSPIEDCKVLLYLQDKDSQLLKETPYYISVTDKSGRFKFSHISDTNFYLYAIKDDNNNNKLDLDERVGFKQQSISANSSNHEIYLSKFISPKPLIINSLKQKYKNVFAIHLNQPLKENIIPAITSPQSMYKNQNVLYRLNTARDSIYLFSSSTMVDSITFNVSLDTFNRVLTTQVDSNLKSHTTHIHPKQHDLVPNKPLILATSYPLLKTKSSAFILTDMFDSTQVSIDTIIKNDAFNLDVFGAFKEGHPYILELKEKAITYENGLNNHLDCLHFSIIESSKTGEIDLSVKFKDSSESPNTFVLHLVKEGKSSIIQSHTISSDTVITYKYLKPGKYNAYIFEDKNADLIWSGSDYLKNIQNEPIWRLKSTIEVRPKWKTKDISIIIK